VKACVGCDVAVTIVLLLLLLLLLLLPFYPQASLMRSCA
jgi:hypothetical protein